MHKGQEKSGEIQLAGKKLLVWLSQTPCTSKESGGFVYSVAYQNCAVADICAAPIRFAAFVL